MKYDEKSRRVRERLKLNLPVRVHSREPEGREWTEVTRLLDVTPFGAGFTLSRPVSAGRLLHLSLPMPRQLRCYDYVEPQYGVWALVRHVSQVEPRKGSTALTFQIGVAFVGRQPPASYLADPTTRYEVAANATEAGLWGVREAEEGDGTKTPRSAETRLQMAFDVTVEVLDADGAAEAYETTVTENVSRKGAAVFTSLKVGRGRFVRLTSLQTGLSLLATVRAARTGPDGIPRLHLEFVGAQWPLEGIEQ
ncbi:MAG TPA: PilZ domain-containing protein [Pyrinomonadaceae bacterium]|nr:PilZ domain-containing protein [Pyrinomonadaceae bacterium]